MTAKNIVMAAAGARQIDPNDAYTSLVLLGEGSNGAQNNTFLDSSASPNTITRYGNATQGTFSPFSKEAGKWGVAFSVAGADYLSIANNTNLNLTGVSFTIEAFVNISTFGNYYYIVDKRSASSVLGWGLLISPTGQLGFFTANGSYNVRYSSQTIKEGSWNHVALVVSDTSAYTYINGIQVGSYTSVSFPEANVPLWIGKPQTSSTGMIGYISNLRITKGAALYTSNFTPSTTPLTTTVASPGTVSLLTCQDNRFKDNSVNNFALTPYGDVKVTPFSPFSNSLAYTPSVHGGSGYFDGSGDYLSVANDLSFPGDFTVEFWYYMESNYNSWANVLFSIGTEGGGRKSFAISGNSSYATKGTLFIDNYGGPQYYFNNTPLVEKTWNHIAFTRVGSIISCFVNGVACTTTQSISGTFGKSDIFYISGGSGSAASSITYISNLRITKGTALYTTTFTPPTAPLTAVSGTSLLCNFTNGAIIDSTGNNNLETVGNAQVSTTTKKFGNGAMYFDGSGDYLTIPASPNLQFGTGDFTIEGWVNVASTSYQNILRSVNGISLGILYNAGSLALYVSSNGSSWDVANGVNIGTIILSNWYHFAITRSKSTFITFLNGTQISTFTSSSTIFNSDGFYIGCEGAGSYCFNGYIDELRITKGKALYTTNFTPSSIANYY
jgi:hypothetical protein